MKDQESARPALLPFGISICGLDEIGAFLEPEVSHVLSILDPGWVDPAEFTRFGGRREIFRFHDIIDRQPGMVAPETSDILRLLDIGERLGRERVSHLLVHCHAGISRSTAASAILLAQFNDGREDEAFREVGRVRSWSWPNSRMVEMADAILGRNGRLVAAMRRHHRRMIEEKPAQSEMLRRGEREREYRLAVGA